MLLIKKPSSGFSMQKSAAELLHTSPKKDSKSLGRLSSSLQEMLNFTACHVTADLPVHVNSIDK
jgi:hypothetical protein